MRYTLNGVPAAQAPAFLPTATVSPVESSYGLVIVHGSPGTTPVRAPKPLQGVDYVDPHTSPSNCSPDIRFPSIYIASTENMGPQVMWRSLNELPVPAVKLEARPKNPTRRARVLGLTAIHQPKVRPPWETSCG